MRLLRYELIEGQEGSYNDLVKQLVTKTRYFFSETSVEEFRSAIPDLKALEKKIQRLDSEFGDAARDYLNEILDELRQESQLEDLLIEEFRSTASILVPRLTDATFDPNEAVLQFSTIGGISYLEFYSYKGGTSNAYEIAVVKQILLSICGQQGVVFIDSSSL